MLFRSTSVHQLIRPSDKVISLSARARPRETKSRKNKENKSHSHAYRGVRRKEEKRRTKRIREKIVFSFPAVNAQMK